MAESVNQIVYIFGSSDRQGPATELELVSGDGWALSFSVREIHIADMTRSGIVAAATPAATATAT